MSLVVCILNTNAYQGPRLHTSPAALMASCETARFLASILNTRTDRLAVMCTSITETSGANSTVVKELSEVKMHRIKTALDSITSSRKKLGASAWTNTIECAKELLLKSMVPDPDEEPLQDTYGHIFFLTPDADSLPFPSLAHEKLVFHIISPAGALRNDQSSMHCNGWKLRSLSEIEIQAVKSKKDLDPMSVFNRLRVLIPQARSGKLLGNLTELVLEIKPGPDCVVEGHIGRVDFTELHPGEVFTALFRLKVGAVTTKDYYSSHPPTRSSEALQKSKDIVGQHDRMVEKTESEILTARLTYRHSLLAAGTMCSVTTQCHMKRHHQDPDQKLSPSAFSSLRPNYRSVLVEKRLAYRLATHGSPREALTDLHSEFGDKSQFSACPDYINLLAKELKYQARIVQRLEIEASPKKSSTVHGAKRPLENGPKSPFGTEQYKPQHSATSDIPTQELFRAEPALAVLSLKESREQLRTDEARRIWGDLKKMTWPPHQAKGDRSISSQLDEARNKGIRDIAVKNKRSVGTDSLRSFFSVGESKGRVLGAPWM